MNLSVLLTKEGHRDVFVLAFSTPGADVPARAIVGRAFGSGDQPEWASFAVNRPFLDFYGSYMRGELAARPRVLDEGRVRVGEKLYVLDPRTPTPKGDVPPVDIVGYYETNADGAPRPETFVYNGKHHRFVTPDGEFSGILREEALLDALAA